MNIKAKMNPTFGENLRAIREKKGYTQTQLAGLSGISRRMIGHYETLIKRPSIDKIQKIADALNVSVDELLRTLESGKKNKHVDEVSYRIMKKVRVIEQLPVRDQNMIFNMIASLAKKNKLEGKI